MGAGSLRRLHRSRPSPTLPPAAASPSAASCFTAPPFPISRSAPTRSAPRPSSSTRPTPASSSSAPTAPPSSAPARTSPSSPDGLALAVVHADAIEIYSLPPLTSKDAVRLKLAQASRPPETDLPVHFTARRSLPAPPRRRRLYPAARAPTPCCRTASHRRQRSACTPTKAAPPTSLPSQPSRLQSPPRRLRHRILRRPCARPASRPTDPLHPPRRQTTRRPERHAPIETGRSRSCMSLYTLTACPRSCKPITWASKRETASARRLATQSE